MQATFHINHCMFMAKYVHNFTNTMQDDLYILRTIFGLGKHKASSLAGYVQNKSMNL